jgi:hypothetical protein
MWVAIAGIVFAVGVSIYIIVVTVLAVAQELISNSAY